MHITDILKNPNDFKFIGKLWLYGKDDRFFGPGRVELLELIDQTGSINKAAKIMEMSYKKAWEMVNSMNSQTNKPMVITHTGGKAGGGAEITAEAREVITFFKALHQRFQAYLESETKNMIAFGNKK
jgi:molybdate transport system regulatory protein